MDTTQQVYTAKVMPSPCLLCGTDTLVPLETWKQGEFLSQGDHGARFALLQGARCNRCCLQEAAACKTRPHGSRGNEPGLGKLWFRWDPYGSHHALKASLQNVLFAKTGGAGCPLQDALSGQESWGMQLESGTQLSTSQLFAFSWLNSYILWVPNGWGSFECSRNVKDVCYSLVPWLKISVNW